MSSERYYTLDLVRGIAAILVVWMHYTQGTNYNVFPGSWMAVDLFFILSGFVVSLSVKANSLRYGNSVAFITHRLIRLYPVYVIGLAIGFLTYAAAISSGLLNSSYMYSVGYSGVLGLVLLPNLMGELPSLFLDANSVYPLNAPSWSIFFEIIVNIIFIPVYFGRYSSSLTKACLFAAPFIYAIHISTVVILHSGNLGWSGENFIFGFTRVISEFLIGYIIYVYRDYIKSMAAFSNKYSFFTVIVLTFMCTALVDSKLKAFIYLLIPTLVCFCVASRDYKPIKATSQFLGSMSYPLYILHMPVIYALCVIRGSNLREDIVTKLIAMAVSIFLAFLLSKIEPRIRRVTERFVFSRARISPSLT